MSAPSVVGITAALLEDELRHNPVNATYLGRHEHDGLLGDPSPEASLELLGLVRSACRRLEELPEASMDADDRLDRDLLLWHRDLMAFDLEEARRHRLGGHPVEDLCNAFHPLFTREERPLELRARAMAGRFAATATYLEHARSACEEPVDLWIDEEAGACGACLELVDSIMTTWESRCPAALGRDLQRGAAAVRGALGAHADWLASDARPRATNSWALGPDGVARMVELRRFGWDAATLRDVGRDEFRRIDDSIAREAERLAPGKGLPAALDAMEADAPPDGEAILNAYREAISWARTLVRDRDVATVPDDEILTVEPTPPFMVPITPSAAYIPPEALGMPPFRGTYLVTPPPDEMSRRGHNRSSIVNVSFHEAYPGHHLQSVQAARHPRPARLLVQGLEFIEGWAHYCEEIMRPLAGAAPPGLTLAQLLDARYRALRVELDVALHSGELTPDEAARTMVARLGLPPATARAEVLFYTRAPGYPMSYLLGKLLMHDLRREAERREGASFSARAFHDRCLAAGGIPVWAHRRLLAEPRPSSAQPIAVPLPGPHGHTPPRA